MKRLVENEMLFSEMDKRIKRNQTGTYEEVVAFQLGAIASILSDISKSLAVIADKVESEE